MYTHNVKDISTRKVILTSLTVNIIDILTNLVIAILTGSMVMIVETIQGVADFISVALVYIGFKKSQSSPSALYPLGRGREIYFWTLLASLFMLGITATMSFYFGFQRFLHPEPVENLFLAYSILVLSILTNGYSLSLGVKKLKSSTSGQGLVKLFFKSNYIEIKTTLVSDLIGTSVAVCGLLSLIFLKYTGDLRFDGIGAMAMGMLLGMLSFILILGSKSFLIGRAATREVHARIKESVDKFPEVQKITELKTIYIGSEKILVLLDLNFENKLSTDKIEKLVQDIKKTVEADNPEVSEIQVELNDL